MTDLVRRGYASRVAVGRPPGNVIGALFWDGGRWAPDDGRSAPAWITNGMVWAGDCACPRMPEPMSVYLICPRCLARQECCRRFRLANTRPLAQITGYIEPGASAAAAGAA